MSWNVSKGWWGRNRSLQWGLAHHTLFEGARKCVPTYWSIDTPHYMETKTKISINHSGSTPQTADAVVEAKSEPLEPRLVSSMGNHSHKSQTAIEGRVQISGERAQVSLQPQCWSLLPAVAFISSRGSWSEADWIDCSGLTWNVGWPQAAEHPLSFSPYIELSQTPTMVSYFSISSRSLSRTLLFSAKSCRGRIVWSVLSIWPYLRNYLTKKYIGAQFI